MVDSAIEKSQLFIDSYDSIVHGDWDRAIAGFDTLYRRDSNFAGGRVRYFLYEAYTSRGDLLVRNGDFEVLLDPADWLVSSNFANSAVSGDIVHSGAGSLHVVASGSGTGQSNSL